MAFPITPTNGQVTTVGNVTYQYNSTWNSWERYSNIANVIVANTITVTTGIYWSNGAAFSSGGGVSSAKSYGMNVLFGS